MAYEVTANRKRPQNFDTLVGQDFVVSTLKNAIKTERIAHAYLFAGPRGVGKTSAARVLAKALNCPQGHDLDSCFDWEGAEEIARGRSIDVIEIDGASNTSVNDIRTIKDEVLFPPQSSRYKIYIIDEVHMLSNSAFNALLKTIEEPPPYIIFIFATTELHKVPATIRSRCQQFVFRLIPLELVRDKLADAAGEMGVTADDEALYWIAKESTGSLRDAYTLFDQVVSFSEGHITLEKIRSKLGLVGLEQINTLVDHLLKEEFSHSLEQFHQILLSGVSVEQLIIDLCEYYRSLLFLKSGVRREALLGYAPERFNREALNKYTAVQLEKILSLLLQTYRDIRYSIDPRFDVEVLLSRIGRISYYYEPDELYSKFKNLEKELSLSLKALPEGNGSSDSPTGNAAESKAEAEKEPGPPASGNARGVSDTPPVRELREEEKKALVFAIRKERLTLAPLFEQISAWELNGDTLVLRVNKQYAADSLKAETELIRETSKSFIPGVQKVLIKSAETFFSEETNVGKDIPPKQDLEPEIEHVREIFRGEIIS